MGHLKKLFYNSNCFLNSNGRKNSSFRMTLIESLKNVGSEKVQVEAVENLDRLS